MSSTTVSQDATKLQTVYNKAKSSQRKKKSHGKKLYISLDRENPSPDCGTLIIRTRVPIPPEELGAVVEALKKIKPELEKTAKQRAAVLNGTSQSTYFNPAEIARRSARKLNPRKNFDPKDLVITDFRRGAKRQRWIDVEILPDKKAKGHQVLATAKDIEFEADESNEPDLKIDSAGKHGVKRIFSFPVGRPLKKSATFPLRKHSQDKTAQSKGKPAGIARAQSAPHIDAPQHTTTKDAKSRAQSASDATKGAAKPRAQSAPHVNAPKHNHTTKAGASTSNPTSQHAAKQQKWVVSDLTHDERGARYGNHKVGEMDYYHARPETKTTKDGLPLMPGSVF